MTLFGKRPHIAYPNSFYITWNGSSYSSDKKYRMLSREKAIEIINKLEKETKEKK